MDVFLDMTLNDVRVVVEDELKILGVSQAFFRNNNPVTDTSKTLTELNISEGDMLGLAIQNPEEINRRRRPQTEGTSSQRQQRPREGPDEERFRLHTVGESENARRNSKARP
jgi:DNA damage-inducible protein 1